MLSWLENLLRRPSIVRRLDALDAKLAHLEAISHGARATYVGNNRVLVKTLLKGIQIIYYVEADDRLLAPWFIASGQYETALTEYFFRTLQPHHHVVDVGANFGFFTCLGARLCPRGRVLGIEADRRIFELVRDNIMINNLQEVASARHAAANRNSDEVVLYRRATRSGNTSIGAVPESFTTLMGEAPAEPFTAPGLRIDDLLPEFDGRIDVIKIDVEGAEPLVLEGMIATIESNPHLRIVMEWSPGQIVTTGYPLPDFIAALERAGLAAALIENDGTTRPLGYPALLEASYFTGIELTRQM